MEYKKFLMFGDSITEFSFNTRPQPEENLGDQFALGAALTNDYSRKLTVLQRGFAGYNSKWGLKILPKILEYEQNIVIGFIFFGSNDSCAGGPQRVPEDEYESNLHKSVQMFKARSIKPILVGPAFYDSSKWEPSRQDEVRQGYARSNEGFIRYGKITASVASKENVPFLDLRAAMEREAGKNWTDFLVDGLHFNGKGYEVFYKELLQAISDHYPEYHPYNMAITPPYWKYVSEDESKLD
ncbi:hypothetical protein ZYGR_0Z00670 [Zygosaccharomyces rouxii]|uniref:ZYRO0G01738p n=2 Tax=Zygosaccharomyces rouxii TaxID=4956 RepID=C5E1V3_ZYGRC|nr:uncharacterized protein ZYRO0G01738g [Zygosaccharomyces rouxii]KAH9202143.1 SGNH hydrolase-type esterase domain-containing protein [Zygosaccharomyces rouxii]GAV50644.1 hypothetical protein ZYGR_0Z00670 [Zygosaccharomyces rouxii]CAR29146.1 ZYRO0G01738p [Zygosaccharomyces rouxii]